MRLLQPSSDADCGREYKPIRLIARGIRWGTKGGCKDFQDEMICKSISGSLGMGKGVPWVILSIMEDSRIRIWVFPQRLVNPHGESFMHAWSALKTSTN